MYLNRIIPVKPVLLKGVSQLKPAAAVVPVFPRQWKNVGNEPSVCEGAVCGSTDKHGITCPPEGGVRSRDQVVTSDPAYRCRVLPTTDGGVWTAITEIQMFLKGTAAWPHYQLIEPCLC